MQCNINIGSLEFEYSFRLSLCLNCCSGHRGTGVVLNPVVIRKVRPGVPHF